MMRFSIAPRGNALSQALLLSRPQKQAIHVWKKYQTASTTTYTWNRWNAVTTTTYKWNKWSTKTIYYWDQYNLITTSSKELYVSKTGEYLGLMMSSDPLYPNIILDSKGFIKGSGTAKRPYDSNTMGYFYIESGSKRANQIHDTIFRGVNGYYSCGDTSVWDIRTISEQSKGSFITTVSATGSSDYPDTAGPYDGYWYENKRSGLIKGPTSYGQVTSTSSSAYPSNGASGSYWYESAGSTTTTSKGSTQYSDASSTNPSAYPNGGASGSYWYDNRTSSVSWSMGSYVGDEVSLERNAYPDDGISGSYWYVYQGIS